MRAFALQVFRWQENGKTIMGAAGVDYCLVRPEQGANSDIKVEVYDIADLISADKHILAMGGNDGDLMWRRTLGQTIRDILKFIRAHCRDGVHPLLSSCPQGVP